jgi:signal transduction histidine kinase
MTDVALLNEKSPSQYVSILWGINAEAERLGRLIGDLLVLARADEEYTPLERMPLRLDLIAHDVAAASSLLANERGIQLRVQTLGPVVVLGHDAQILQVVLNIVHNDLTYTTPRGLVTLRVETAGDWALLSVNDTGIGIEPEHLPHVFERFYRANPAYAHSMGGSGLGLAIVDWVVGAHGGEVTVQSQVGVGFAFTLLLLLATSSAAAPNKELLPVEKTGKLNGALIEPT